MPINFEDNSSFSIEVKALSKFRENPGLSIEKNFFIPLHVFFQKGLIERTY